MLTIKPNNKEARIYMKEEDRTCQVDIINRGTFLATIENLSSNGTVTVKLLKKILEEPNGNREL